MLKKKKKKKKQLFSGSVYSRIKKAGGIFIEK
jgi:hypothetical protein